jgi:hypothetical protein
MQDRKMLGRREFTAASAMAVLSGVAITVTGCGGSSSPAGPTTPAPTPAPTPTPATPSGDISGTVGTNHGHSAVITDAQLTAAEEVSLDITGDSSHPHTVDLTAAEVQQIGAGQRVSKESSNDASHTHTVTFN